MYGDEILAVDERRISKVEELLDAIEGKRVGSKVTLKLSRDGTVRNEKLTLAERPAPKQMVFFKNQTPPLPNFSEKSWKNTPRVFCHFAFSLHVL